VALLHVPLLVGREFVGLMTGVAIVFPLMLGVGKSGRLLAGFGLDGDLGRALVRSGKSGAGDGRAGGKGKGYGTDDGFLHFFLPWQLVYKERGEPSPQ